MPTMIDATRTTTQLLEGLRAGGDDASWRELDTRYRPILIHVARRQGVREADAMDVAQDVLMAFAKAYAEGRYDREKGRLRMWLMGIARRAIADYKRAAPRRGITLAETPAECADDGLEATWDAEQRREILRQGFARLGTESRLAPATLRAFELHVVEGRPVQGVVEELGVSAHDVYLAKSRCLSKLRELCEEIERAFEGD